MVMRPDGSLTRKGRLLRTSLFLILLSCGIVVGTQAFAVGDGTIEAAGGADGRPAVLADTYTVAPGDTLWSIAASIKPEGEDIRDVVDRIQSLNGMDSARIVAGEQILIPIVP